MKVLFSASLFGLMLASSAAAQLATYKTGDEIQGKPQTIRVEVARFSEKSGTLIEGGRIPASEFNYDSRGRMIRSLVYDFKGSLYAKYSATIDDRGNPTEEVYYSPKDSILDQMLYTYDSSGRLIQKEVAKAKTAPRNIIVYKYDNSDRISGKSRPDVGKSPGYDSTYAYDDQGRNIEVIRYDQKGKLIGRSVETFNGQGRLADRHMIFGDKSQEWRSTLVYDSKGNLTDETFNIFGAQGRWRYTYEFDAKGNWIKKTVLALTNREGSNSYVPTKVFYRSIAYASDIDMPSQEGSGNLGAIVSKIETRSYLTADVLEHPRPVYPSEARLHRETGKVEVFVMVDENGDVVSAKAAPGVPPRLSNAATAAARLWKFTPTLSGGRPVRLVTTTTFNFDL